MERSNDKLNTNPTRYIIAGLVVIFCFFGGLTAWAVYFPFEGAVIASGTVKVFGERKKVQHLEGGMIKKIYVKEGDQVEKGQVLLELKSSSVVSSVVQLEGELWARLAEEARLKAEIGMKDHITWPKELLDYKETDEAAELLSTEKDIFTYRRSDMHGKISLYESQIKQLGNRIEGAREEYKSVEAVIDNIVEELEAKRPLVKDKYLGKSDILALERSLAQYVGRKGKLTQDIAEYQQIIEGYKLNIVDLKNKYRETAVSRLGDIKDMIFQTRNRIKPYLDARERLTVRAPISGEIIDLQVNSEGSGVIQPGMPLMDIVPARSRLIVEAMVRPQDITQVSKGQETKVSLAAFQRANLPPVLGKVAYISSDLVHQQDARGTVSYYVAHVEVDQKDLEEKGAYLSPGMPVACYITTDKRNVISYLLGPLLENVDRAMRE